ncbi:hypothetical protein M9458_010985, partial [Cirrhinus mrigala]
ITYTRLFHKELSSPVRHRGYKPQASLRQRELEPVKLPQKSPVPEDFPLECSSERAPMLECSSQGTPAETPQEEPVVANVPEEGPHRAPMPKLFTLVISIPTFSTRNFHVQKERSQCRGYKPQASKRQREPEPVKLPQKSPVPEDFPQQCSSERAPMLECFSQETPAETPQEEPVLANFLEGGPHGAPIPKLFTLGISIPIFSTKKYRLHKHQASLTHRTHLLVITADKSPAPESSLLGEATVEAMEPYSSSSDKAAKAQKEAPMPECSPEVKPMLVCSLEDEPEQKPQRRRKKRNQNQQ